MVLGRDDEMGQRLRNRVDHHPSQLPACAVAGNNVSAHPEPVASNGGTLGRLPAPRALITGQHWSGVYPAIGAAQLTDTGKLRRTGHSPPPWFSPQNQFRRRGDVEDG
jgi:hypothetical protein